MLKELLALIQLVRLRFSYEKQELEQRIFFWLLKGTLCLIALVFLAVAIFLSISNIFGITELAAFITAAIFIAAYAVVSLICYLLNKYKCTKVAEKLNIVLPVIEAFLEGLNYEENKNTKTKKKT